MIDWRTVAKRAEHPLQFVKCMFGHTESIVSSIIFEIVLRRNDDLTSGSPSALAGIDSCLSSMHVTRSRRSRVAFRFDNPVKTDRIAYQVVDIPKISH